MKTTWFATLCLLWAWPVLDAVAQDTNVPPICSNIYNTIPLFNPLHIKVQKDSEEYAVQLSHLPVVKVSGVLDNVVTGRRIPLIWDPLDSPRLSYAVNLSKGEWTLTFRSEYLFKSSETASRSTEKHSITYQPVIEIKDVLKNKDNVLREEYEHIVNTCRDSLNQNPTSAQNLFHPCIKIEIYKDYIERKQKLIKAVCPNGQACEKLKQDVRAIESDKNNVDSHCAIKTDAELRQFRLQPSDLFSYLRKDEQLPLWNARNSDIIVSVWQIDNAQREKGGLRLASEDDTSGVKLLTEAVDGMGASEWRAATGRSFSDAAPQVLVDLFSILAEIAFERAKAKSFSILSEKASDLVCVKLTGNALREAAPKNAAAAAKNAAALEWLPEGSRPLLPQTCEVVQGLRIQELATSGKSLYNAFIRDLIALSIRSVTKLGALPEEAPERQLLVPLLQPLLAAVQTHVLNPGALSERDVQVLFLTLAKEYVRITGTMLGNAALPPALCPVRLALAVVAECQARGGCDAPAISEYLYHPEKYLSDGLCLEQWHRIQSRTSQLISRGLEIVRPSKAVTPPLQLRNVASFVLDAIEPLVLSSPGLKFPFDQESLAALRNIVNGTLEQEIQLVLTGCGQLVTHGLSGVASKSIADSTAMYLRKFTAVTGAIASYAQSYTANGEALDEKQAKAQREARKKAIESMMELTTSRSARAGDFIASLGIMPAVSVIGGQDGPGVHGDGGLKKLQYTQLTLPTGIALQWLPGPFRGLGWHLQVSFLDIAQFVSFDGSSRPSMDSLTWADFVMVGLQAGMLLGKSPNGLFFLGVDLRYAPTLSFQDDPDKKGAFRGSLSVGYYVPFFDFN